MFTTEVRNSIAESPSAEWFNSIEITINYTHIKFSEEIKSFGSIHRFFSRQKKGWDKIENLPPVLQTSKNHFDNMVVQIETFLTNYKDHPENTIVQQWNSQLHPQLVNQNNILTFDSPYTLFLIEVQKNRPESIGGAFQFITSNNGQIDTNNKQNFIGNVLAYEFELSDFTELVNRRSKEKISIISLRKKLSKHVNEIENQLDEHLLNSNNSFKEYSEKIDRIKTSKEKLFDEWFKNSSEEFSTFNDDSISKIKKLEETYNQKLKLEAPAEYWDKRGKKLQKQGWIAFTILLVALGVVTFSLGEILWNAPDQIYESFKGEDKSGAIRWSIVYITFISFMAYGIRAITKVMFSSFHLARDAQERHTLTYFYLSLLKASDMDEKERHLIMQSLFSRSETGLLKDDSSPTMPSNDFIGKLLGK
jgi:hypothetical protein